jgi:ABC-type glutathione transport system ATPase component
MRTRTDAVLGLCALLIKQFHVFPRAIKTFDEAFISFRRIERFLRLPEVISAELTHGDAASPAARMEDEGVVVRVDEAAAMWSTLQESDENSRPFELRGISFAVRRGEVCFVLGEVGCGKSSL